MTVCECECVLRFGYWLVFVFGVIPWTWFLPILMVPPLVFPLFGPPHVSGILQFTLLKLLVSGVWLLTLDSSDISSDSSGGSVLCIQVVRQCGWSRSDVCWCVGSWIINASSWRSRLGADLSNVGYTHFGLLQLSMVWFDQQIWIICKLCYPLLIDCGEKASQHLLTGSSVLLLAVSSSLDGA